MGAALLMPFGKHEGKPIEDIPESYLKYLWDKNIITMKKWNAVYTYVKNNLDVNKFSDEESQVGCGYCYKEKSCMVRDPKVNKAKLGCDDFKHYKSKLDEDRDI